MNAPFVVAQAITTGQGTSRNDRQADQAGQRPGHLGARSTPTRGSISPASPTTRSRSFASATSLSSCSTIRRRSRSRRSSTPNGNPLDGIDVDLGQPHCRRPGIRRPVSDHDRSEHPAGVRQCGRRRRFRRRRSECRSAQCRQSARPSRQRGRPPASPSPSTKFSAAMATRPAPIEPAPTAFSQTIGIDEDGDGFAPTFPICPTRFPAARATIRPRR